MNFNAFATEALLLPPVLMQCDQIINKRGTQLWREEDCRVTIFKARNNIFYQTIRG